MHCSCNHSLHFFLSALKDWHATGQYLKVETGLAISHQKPVFLLHWHYKKPWTETPPQENFSFLLTSLSLCLFFFHSSGQFYAFSLHPASLECIKGLTETETKSQHLKGNRAQEIIVRLLYSPAKAWKLYGITRNICDSLDKVWSNMITYFRETWNLIIEMVKGIGRNDWWTSKKKREFFLCNNNARIWNLL